MNNATEFNISEQHAYKAMRRMFAGVLQDNEIDPEEAEFDLTDKECKEWLRTMIEDDLYFSFQYSDKRNVYIPCLRSI